jgi:hypothetical protein
MQKKNIKCPKKIKMLSLKDLKKHMAGTKTLCNELLVKGENGGSLQKAQE